VAGRLQVNGVLGNEVRFTTTNRTIKWRGIQFIDNPPGSYFNNCIIENSLNSGVRITNSLPVGGGMPAFTNCAILNNSSPDIGGGICAISSSGDLVMDNCVISGNTSAIYGGGINAELKNGALRLVSTTVQSNTVNPNSLAGRAGGFRGGGLRVRGDSALLNCTIAGNVCNASSQRGVHCGESYGGGLFLESGESVMRNCWLNRNIARTSGNETGCETSLGGALYVDEGRLLIQNCIVVSNSCIASFNSRGSGLYLEAAAVDVINCSLIGNASHGVSADRGQVNLLNSILYFNNLSGPQILGAVNVRYSNVQGGAAGEGNRAVNPNLHPETFALLSVSPCIDAGNPDVRYNDGCLPPSRGSSRNDLGAYGGPGACCWDAPCAVPVIVVQPRGTNSCVHGDAVMCVAAVGAEPLRYQWRFHGNSPVNPPQDLPGETNACVSLSNLDSGAQGYYSVVAMNMFGLVTSDAAPLRVDPLCVDIDLYAGLTISGGVPGQRYRIEYKTDIMGNEWTRWTNVTQSASGVFILDPQPANQKRRFYRALP
jgi:hypothetical protein